MKELGELIRDGEFIKKDYVDKVDFLNDISDFLIERGFVKEKFKEEIIKREEQFPTGLLTKRMNVSIPHSEEEYVLKEGIIVTNFPKKLKFNRMDKPNEEIKVDISFILLLKDKNKHITVLQQLADLFQSQMLLEIKNCNSKEDIYQLLREAD